MRRVKDSGLTIVDSMLSRSLVSCVLCLVSCVLLAANGETAVRHQRVTVGMYNTYSVRDGNLGRAEPDLKEVWEGVPDVSDFEACNITMHYWPRPEDLPDVEKNPYSTWWKAYMEEAYNLTNQNGEVRLKVIVGPLYSYYTAYRGRIFNGFIEDLCRWEKDSMYAGTLAGWYLAEEPMGSSHNFDPAISNEMADAIKAVEDSVGTRHHTMYIDVSVDGLHFSPASLAAFTRPADVVMISSSSYVWTTSIQQPVYEPNWNTIHGPMKQVRDIVYGDRRRRDLPLPEIHVVLEARDAIGHGQPTNWEMRQQIHIALSQSLVHNDQPADGVWFFWWSEIARNARDDTDDWNYGRRIAEAIQTQVARSTFVESPWVRKDYDPNETRFRFPEFGSFNPANSCIPYDLAEPGYVRIEIFDENMSLLRDSDMKYQVAGRLRRFGGPYWYRADAPNGFYIFRLYLNSKLMDEVKVKVQWSITLNSTSHQPGVWSSNNVVEVRWEPQPEDVEGLAGYSILWDASSYSRPDTNRDLTSAVTSLRSDPLPDGDSNYFHIRSVDGAGDWSTTAHLGPFYIDNTEPGNVKDLASDPHTAGEWSKNNTINVYWNPAEDASSGIKGYSVLWDGTPGTLPNEEVDISGDVTVLASGPLRDGEYYFHIRSADNAGNWAYTAAHIGPLLIDMSPPEGVTDLVSSSHVPGQWSNDDTVMVNWRAAEDLGSGIGGYSVLCDSFADTIPGESVNTDSWATSLTSPPLESSADLMYYFHIRSVDGAGNWASDAQHLGPFMIDAEPPSKIEGLVSTSHDPDEWSPQTLVDVSWTQGEDNISGIAGYQWSISHHEHAELQWTKPISLSAHEPIQIQNRRRKNAFLVLSLESCVLSLPLSDGLWYIHIRAVDNAGNAGASECVMVKIDSEPPAPPVIRSPSHPDDNIWYTDTEATFEWTSEDETSGIDGYSWSCDTEPETTPDETKDILGRGDAEIAPSPPRSLTLLITSPGVWYFHLRAVDSAGNWSEPSHYRIQVDPSAPSAPRINSDTHRDSEWIARSNVRLSWEIPVPGPSGIAGYSYSLDHNPSLDTGFFDPASSIQYPDLPDGVWYFHCRAKSGSGLWGPAAHYEIRIDTEPPQISITYPRDGKWYTDPITKYSGTVDDRTSGVDWDSFGYSYNGRAWTSFHPYDEKGNWSDYNDIPRCDEAQSDTLQVRVEDKAGNLGISDPITIRVDRSVSPPVIVSSMHPDQDTWYTVNDPDFAWDFSDSVSGADGCSWAIDHSEATVPPPIRMIDGRTTFKTDIHDLSDGVWYFHLRGRDSAGNWSEPSHYRVKIDSTHPTARLELSGPAVAVAQTVAVVSGLELPVDPHLPLVRAGPVEVLLHTSETVFEPALEYRSASATSPVPIELTGFQNEWRGSFHVIANTGDGEAVFLFSARDEAGNVGSEITAGGSFLIDTTPPTARLKLSGPAVAVAQTVAVAQAAAVAQASLPVDPHLPLVQAGPVEVLLQTSETVFEPALEYKPDSATSPIPIELISSGVASFSLRPASRNQWRGSFDVTIHTGDGEAVFSFSARDEAGNIGSEITAGGSFVVDTLIRADAAEALEVLCVPEPETKIALPPGAITQDLRIEIVKDTSQLAPGMIAMYDFIAYDSRMREFKGLTFRVPVEITFSEPTSLLAHELISLYYWDGVKWHKVQDEAWMTVRVDYVGRFALMKSEPMDSGIMHGWAAPNPFTPNGSGDATDRVIFHVATKYGSTDFTVNIYDLNGRLVKRLEGGRRAWDGTDEDGHTVEGGLYIYQIQSGDQIISGTVVVLK